MSTKTRGFGSPNYGREKARAICSLGGQRARDLGVAHRWTKETAAAAGRKGGVIRAANALARREGQQHD